MLAVLLLEFLHELDKGFCAFNSHGVVNGSAHAADRAMTLESDQIILLGFLGKGIFEFLGGEAEGNVHDGACFRCSMTTIETTALIDHVVNRIGFLAVDLLNLC